MNAPRQAEGLCGPCLDRGVIKRIPPYEPLAFKSCCLSCWRAGWAVVWFLRGGETALPPDRPDIPRAVAACGCVFQGNRWESHCPDHEAA